MYIFGFLTFFSIFGKYVAVEEYMSSYVSHLACHGDISKPNPCGNMTT